MSSGIFGPRAPSYPLPSYSPRISSRRPYSMYSAYPQSTSNLPVYSQPTYSPTLYTQQAYSQPSFPQSYTTSPSAYYTSPYQGLPTFNPGYSGINPYYSSALYPASSQNRVGISPQGLESILVAILILVSLDLILVRPLHSSR